MVTGECKLLLFPKKLQQVPRNQTIQVTRSWSLLSQKRSWSYHFANPLQASCIEMLAWELNHWEMLLQEVTTQIWIPMTSLWIMGILLGIWGKMIRAKRNCELLNHSEKLYKPIKIQSMRTEQGRMHERPWDRYSINSWELQLSSESLFPNFCVWGFFLK